jgi:hypothetical protein
MATSLKWEKARLKFLLAYMTYREMMVRGDIVINNIVSDRGYYLKSSKT